MRLWRKFKNWLPRPSLLWLSYNDVLRVRNQIAGLCYPRGDFMSVPIARGIWGDLFPGMVPKFVFPLMGLPVTAWLKVIPGDPPVWDMQETDGKVETVPFDHAPLAPLAALVVKWSRNFTYKPHKDSLTHKGEFLA